MEDKDIPNNPYVGPRAIESGEAFYGRDKEVRSLSALLVSERIVLLHSPSGAGKSSLIQAGLAPRMAERFNLLHLVRVNLELPEELRGKPGLNRYVFSTLISLDEGLPPEERTPLHQLADLTLEGYLSGRPQAAPDASAPAPGASNDLLIFDQFEEVLTVSPTDGDAKQEFFEQLGEVLQNQRRWALFAIREDYMGGLAPYVRAIPNRLAVTFRLGLLGPEAARLAIQEPARNAQVDFTDAAAMRLVDDLRSTQVQQPDGSFVTEAGPDVEPVQLQVVCYNMWSSAADDKVIDENDLHRVGSVDQALATYYAGAVGRVAESAGMDERLIRRWFDEHLITPEGIRSQVLMGAESTEGLPNSALSLLAGTYLVRRETRAGKNWYELSHDRLVKPIRQDNTAWFEKNLTLLQRQSVLWNQQGRGEGLLLRGRELEDAEREARKGQLTADEQDFLEACLGLRKRERRELVQKRLVRVGFVTSVILLVVTVMALYRAKTGAALLGQALVAANALGTEGTNKDRVNNTAQAANTQGALGILNEHATATQVMNVYNADQTSTAQANVIQSGATAQANADNLSKQVEIADGYRGQSLADTSRLARLYGQTTLSTLLGIEAFKIADNNQTRGNLLNILGTSIQVTSQPNLSDSGLMQNTMSFSPDGSVLAAGYVDGTVVLWKAQDLAWLGMRGEGSTPKVSGLAYSPDGKTILKSEYSQIVSLWDALKPGRVPDPMAMQEAQHGDDILCVAFSPDGEMFATGGSSDKSIRLWATASLYEENLKMIGQPMSGNEDWVQAVVFSPDGKLLASAGRDSKIRLWDVATQKLVGTLSGHENIVFTVAFSPDGKILASGSFDRMVILWDAATQKMIGEPRAGHLGAVNSVAFSPDGKLLVSGSNDGTLILWDVESHQKIGQIYTDSLNQINNVVFHPSGRMFASGSKDGLIGLWSLDAQEWIKDACRLVTRNMTPKEWELYFPREEYRNTCAK